MKKYDLSKIMKRAHEIKREDKKNVWGICLKMAWNEVKNPEILPIKYWFQKKLEEENNAYIYNWESTPIRESEKAVLINIKFQTFTGREFYKNCWIPKSCIGKEEMLKKVERAHSGLNYNQVLVNFAKEKCIKGARAGLKTKTLIQKIAAAGYEVPERA